MFKKAMPVGRQGFTLIELLVVIGIIAILAVIVLVAVNPARQFAQARNAQRSNDTSTILNGAHQNAVDHNGILPNDNAGAAIASCPATTAAATMSTALVPTYVSTMPADPSNVSDYTLCQDASGRLTVNAPGAELGATISVTR